MLCDAPTKRMREMAVELGIDVEWGPRRAAIYELSSMGALLATVMTSPPDPSEFRTAALHVLDEADAGFSADVYRAVDPQGGRGRIRYSIWSDVLVAACCGAQIPLWNAAARRDPARLETQFSCPGCGTLNTVKSSERLLDPEGKRVRVLAWVYGITGSHMWSRAAVPSDTEALHSEGSIHKSLGEPIEWGDLRRSGYHAGIDTFADLYTARNAAVLSAVWQAIEAQPAHMQAALKVWALSFNAAHATLMTRVVAKKSQRDFSVSGAQSGVLYVSGLPVEKNVFLGLRRKISVFAEAFRLVSESVSSVRVINASSTAIDLPDESVDYVFTDPPFGDYIPYAELNQVNEVWLGALTDRAEEVIMSPAQSKGVTEYGALLERVFSEVARVMRADAEGTIIFHSSRPEVWNRVSSAFSAASLEIQQTAVLDKEQTSFKQSVHANGTRGDAILRVRKATSSSAVMTSSQMPGAATSELAAAVPTDGRYEYSRYVAESVRVGEPVQLTPAQYREQAVREAS